MRSDQIWPQKFLMMFACLCGSLVGVSVIFSLSVMRGVLVEGMRWVTLSVMFLWCFCVERKCDAPYDLSSLFLSLLSMAGFAFSNCLAM